jgi:hypothetical protein
MLHEGVLSQLQLLKIKAIQYLIFIYVSKSKTGDSPKDFTTDMVQQVKNY